MLCIYNTRTRNAIEKTNKIESGCWINLETPTTEEITSVCKSVNIKDEFIRYALDSEEKPRVEYDDDDNTRLIIIDVPIDDDSYDGVAYNTIPLGMIVVRDDIFITVSLKNTEVVNRFKNGYRRMFSTRLKSRFVLQLFYESALSYLRCLRSLNKEKDRIESDLAKTYRNPELLSLLNIQNSLVYFETSLKANEAVMERLQRGRTLSIFDDDKDVLDDAIIENKQAIEMTQIYANVLESSMNVYGSIISNNLSGIMRFLTSVTIFLAIPTMVAGFFGMNVAIPGGMENPIVFWGIVVGSMAVSAAISMIIGKKRS